jgi:hypothetical protein
VSRDVKAILHVVAGAARGAVDQFSRTGKKRPSTAPVAEEIQPQMDRMDTDRRVTKC